jgi:trehalose 6-phosphate phosphatase
VSETALPFPGGVNVTLGMFDDAVLIVPSALKVNCHGVVAAAGDDPGVWIEDKRLSLVVHTRRAADPAGALAALRAPVTALCEELGLECHDGKLVLEVRLPGFDKGAALRALVAETGPRQVLYAGDDVGDLPAFAEIARLRAEGLAAWSIAAASAELPELSQAADISVSGPAGVVELLVQLV